MGVAQAESLQPSHRVLNREVWSALAGARLLLLRLGARRAPSGPLVIGWDDTLERRRGAKRHATGIYRAPVRSSHSPVVNASGLRGVSLLLLVPSTGAKRVWALPCVTVWAPSEGYHQERGQRPQTLTDGARHMLLVVRRWVPERPLVLGTESRFAVITLLWCLGPLPYPIGCVTRWRLAAARYAPAPPRTSRQRGRPRLQGQRLPSVATGRHEATTWWPTVTVRGGSGAPERVVAVTSATAGW
jgi:hypothetical protein